MNKVYLVVRPFRDRIGMLLAGTVVRPDDLRWFKVRLRDKHIREVTEDNFEEIASYLQVRHKVVLEDYETLVARANEYPTSEEATGEEETVDESHTSDNEESNEPEQPAEELPQEEAVEEEFQGEEAVPTTPEEPNPTAAKATVKGKAKTK